MKTYSLPLGSSFKIPRPAVLDANGEPIADVVYSYRSSNPAVAKVDRNGTVQAKQPNEDGSLTSGGFAEIACSATVGNGQTRSFVFTVHVEPTPTISVQSRAGVGRTARNIAVEND